VGQQLPDEWINSVGGFRRGSEISNHSGQGVARGPEYLEYDDPLGGHLTLYFFDFLTMRSLCLRFLRRRLFAVRSSLRAC